MFKCRVCNKKVELIAVNILTAENKNVDIYTCPICGKTWEHDMKTNRIAMLRRS